MIQVLITGGTLDKQYDEISGELLFRQSHLEDALRVGRCRKDVCIETLMLVDSLHLTCEDRKKICNKIVSSDASQMVITHGTDTMEVTAAYLQDHLPFSVLSRKSIVLTGAMVPYFVRESDVLFNLGCAIAFVQTLSCGVYVAMNGLYFPAHHVKKNRKQGVFEHFVPGQLSSVIQ